MLPISIAYFDISAEQEWNEERGHHVRVGYNADIPQTMADNRFDVLEDIVLVMEWKTTVDGEEVLIQSREHRIFPQERIPIPAGIKIVRDRHIFVTRQDLRWEKGFPEMAEMFCRISLTPLLATARRSIPIERIDGRYRMIPGQIGYPQTPITPGYEY